uniref:Uncharacterized protein n=1 Tax=Schistosoma mansoni TaxID=6183 RepID=A0A913KVK3_SCHMA
MIDIKYNHFVLLLYRYNCFTITLEDHLLHGLCQQLGKTFISLLCFLDGIWNTLVGFIYGGATQ